jgi:hypothetical protein
MVALMGNVLDPCGTRQHGHGGEDEAELDHRETKADRDAVQAPPFARLEVPRGRRRNAGERQ